MSSDGPIVDAVRGRRGQISKRFGDDLERYGRHVMELQRRYGLPADRQVALFFGNIRDEPLVAIWERLRAHPAYCQRSDHCRMQDPEFRRRYIDGIPRDVPLPWPATEELLDHANCPRTCGARQPI